MQYFGANVVYDNNLKHVILKLLNHIFNIELNYSFSVPYKILVHVLLVMPLLVIS